MPVKRKRKIVLVRPNYKSHIITPPLGIGYLSSYLKKNKVEVILVDALKDNLTTAQVVKKVLKEEPMAVGITCLTAFYIEVVKLSKLLKKNGFKVIIGGVHPTFMPAQTLKDSGADFVVLGEGEEALLKLVKSDLKRKNIPGAYSRDTIKKKMPLTKAQAVVNLDLLPFPDWEQMDPRGYPMAPHGAIAKNFPIGIIITTRGCPYMCSFCASPKFYERKIRYRSPGNVVKEIKHLVKNCGIKEVHFEDDNLTLKRNHVEKLCRSIVRNKIKISWACPNGIRADKVDEKLLKLMKKAGCYYVAFGIESANPQILKNIHKLETIDTIQKAITTANKVGIQTQGFFIFGLPGETKDTIEESIQFAKKSKLARAQFIILDVIPGSELWDTLKGKFKPNWKKNSYKEPEWIPKGLTKKYLMEAQGRAFRQFYFRPTTFLRLIRFIKPNQVKFLLQRFGEYRLFKTSPK